MTKDLFYEIGTEEIPARFINSAIIDINTIIKNYLSELKIKYSNIEVYSTPRRFAIVIRNINDKQDDIEDFIKGPSKKISFDNEGNPTKALIGFVNSKGGSLDNIDIVDVNGDEYVYLKIFKKGEKTSEFIKDILYRIIRNINFPKPMKWGNKNIKFIRPIRWLICLYGEELQNFDIEGIFTSNITKGHRFLGENNIEVFSFDDYKQKLKDNFVILDHIERREIIKSQALNVGKSLGGNTIISEDILDEVNFIVEYPTAFYGNFDKEYLNLPKEVVITPMQNHQRYFPVVDDSGKLMNYFVTVRNGDDYMIDNVRKGNNRVLDARLKDAQFFYNEDIKKSLEAYIPNLKTIVFHQKLGTMYDKMERLRTLSKNIAIELGFDTKNLDKASMLCKADLTTQMVFEFGELQGIMGSYYAKLSGENDDISNAILEHYLPRNAEDDVAKSETGIVLALADKIDTIVGFFSIGIQPSGSQDPYALRRQAIGILSTLIRRNLNISISKLVDFSIKSYNINLSEKEKSNIVDFLILRLNNILLDLGIRHDIIKALSVNKDLEVHKIVDLAHALMNWLNQSKTEEFTTFNRANNLIKNYCPKQIDETLFIDDSERKLFSAVLEINILSSEFIKNQDYIAAFNELEKVVKYIDNLFDSVMIMDENEKIRENRLSLLFESIKVLKSILDIEEINYK